MNDTRKLEKYIENNIPVYLYGTPGTGKTEIIIKLADKLGKEIVTQSVSPLATKGEFFGFMSIDGKSYVRTVFREAYETGKIFLLDEMDLLSPSLSPVLNQSLSQNWLTFPDGIVKKHKDFLFVGTGNTNGKGSREGFAGRQPLDNSFLDRFLSIEWFLDENLEKEISPHVGFCSLVQEIRKVSNRLGIGLQVTMRSSMLGGKALKTYEKFDETDILELLEISIFKGKIDKNSKDKILNSDTVKNIIKILLEEKPEEKSELEEIEESEFEKESKIQKTEEIKFFIKILSPTPENIEKYKNDYSFFTLDESKVQEKNNWNHFSGEITKNKIFDFMGKDRIFYNLVFFTYTKEKKSIIESQLKREKLI